MPTAQRRIDAWGRLFRMLPPAAPGKTRLAQALLNGLLENQSDLRLTDADGNSFLVPNFSEGIGLHLLIDGVYEPLTVRFLSRCLAPGSVFVDVGANIGIFSIPAAKQVGPRGSVIAVEPSPSILPYLAENIARNNAPNVRVQACAAHSERGSIRFYEGGTHFGMGSCVSRFHDHPVPVEGKPLDDILAEERVERVAALKVDVEGHEASVFLGARRLLSRPDPPWVLFEFIDWAEPEGRAGEAQRLLLGHGYRLCRVQDFLKGARGGSSVMTSGCAMIVGVPPCSR